MKVPQDGYHVFKVTCLGDTHPEALRQVRQAADSQRDEAQGAANRGNGLGGQEGWSRKEWVHPDHLGCAKTFTSQKAQSTVGTGLVRLLSARKHVWTTSTTCLCQETVSAKKLPMIPRCPAVTLGTHLGNIGY